MTLALAEQVVYFRRGELYGGVEQALGQEETGFGVSEGAKGFFDKDVMEGGKTIGGAGRENIHQRPL